MRLDRNWQLLVSNITGPNMVRIEQLFYGTQPTEIRFMLEVTEYTHKHKAYRINRYYYVDGDPEHQKFDNVIFAERRLAAMAFMDFTPVSSMFE